MGRRTSLEVEPRGSSHVGRAPVDTHNAGRHACLERCVFDCGDLNTCCAYVALTCRTVWKVLFPCCTALGLLHILSPPSTVHLHGTAFLLRPLGYLVITLPQPLALVNDGGRGNKMVTGEYFYTIQIYNTRSGSRAGRDKGASEGQARTTHAMGPPPHELTQTHAKKRKLKHGAGCASP